MHENLRAEEPFWVRSVGHPAEFRRATASGVQYSLTVETARHVTWLSSNAHH